jgi:hypothetical protein
VRFRGVLFPCDGLTLDAVESPTEHTAEPHGEPWVAKSTTLKLWANEGTGPTMEVALAHPGDLELHRLEQNGAWWKVESRFRDGSYLTAWAKAADLTKPPAHHELQDLPVTRPACTRAPEATGGARIQRVTVTAGTAVSAERLFPWATVRGGDPIAVRFKEGERWVELVGVPGITEAGDCEGSTVLEEAWVPRTAVQWQGGSPDGGTK